VEDCCKIAQPSILSMSFGMHIANSPSDQGPDQSKDPIGEILNRGELKEIPVLENRFCGRRFVGAWACPPSPPRKKGPGNCNYAAKLRPDLALRSEV
jgi:hypothetical protein